MSSHNPMRQLHRLDRSSSKFHDQLSDILCEAEYKQWVPNLQGDDLAELVDYLAKALDALDPTSPGFQKCLRELRHICGARAILPTSYALSSQVLTVGDQPVASGGFSDIYEGSLDGARVCVKRVRVYAKGGPEKATETLYQEAVVWKRLEHQNIVPLLGVTSTPLQLISEWMPGGDLTGYIKKYPGADRPGLLFDVAEGLYFLHSHNIVHGDLKGPNILVDGVGHARITDFGISTVAKNPDSIHGASDDRGHTTRWTAPEILNEEGTLSKKADVFSFAMVMIEAFTGAVPFSNSLPVAAMLATMTGKRPSRPTHPALTDKLWTLIQRFWNQDPRLRPDISKALQLLSTPGLPAWKRSTDSSLPTHERISLIVSIFSDRNEVEMVGNLCGDDAQSFIDTINGVLDSLPPQVRRKCLRTGYRICGRQALLPTSLKIPLCYDPMKSPLCRGGFADVWKSQYRGKEVAAKALRVYLTNDFEKIRRRFCREVMTWNTLRHPNVLPLLGVTMTETRFVMVSEWMVKGNIKEFVRANIEVDRLRLLGGVARGLIYMHDQGVVHGDLKGTNILINHDGHACIADFSLLTMVPDQSTFLSSCIQGGTFQWMSPELLDPERFGLKKIRPTKESDCYALGMVIFEVLSGRAPFAPCTVPVIIQKVMEGKRPERPQGDEGMLFTDAIWTTLELCWKHQAGDRTDAKAVLSCLEGNPPQGRSSSPDVGGDVETDTEDLSDETASKSSLPITHGESELPVPSHNQPSRSSVASSPIAQVGDQILATQQTGNLQGGWVGRLARRAQRSFKHITIKR